MRCIEELSALLTKNIPEETILLVQNADEGRRLLAECAGTGRLLVGVRAATPLMLAQEICAPMLARTDAPRLLSRGEARDLFFRTLLEMPEEGFFARPHVRRRKTAEMLLETVNELNRELVPPLCGNERLEAVQRLRERWQAVKGSKLLDRADLLQAAVCRAESDCCFQETAFVLLSTEILPALDRQLIDAIAGERLMVFPVETPEGARIPECCAGSCGKPVPIDRGKLRFRRCRGAETEQKAIMRDILSKGRAAEDCAVVYLNQEDAPGLYAAAQSFHLPIAMAEGIPMTDSTVYEVLNLLRAWPLSDFNAEELRKTVTSDALKVTAGGRLCRKLRKDKVGWGKARYYDLLLRPDENGFPDAETAEDWRRLLDLLFQAAERSGTPAEQKRVLTRLLDSAVRVGREEDASALAAAKRLLAEISWLEEGETVLDRLLELTEQTAAAVGGSETGKLLVLPLTQAFCTGRKYLYFCGLSRFSMQSGAGESPILLDEERVRFGLAGKQEQEIRSTFRFLLSLSQHGGEAVLSYSDYDMERMNELPPAPVYRGLLGGEEAEAISCVPEEAMALGDLISAGKRIRFRTPDPDGEEGEEETGEYELRGERSFEEAMENMAYSASSMETALACPFKFYMQKLVGLYPPDLPERRNDSWLEANEMGTLCHAVLERYYRDPDSDWEGILQEEIGKMKQSRPAGPESAVNADRDKARRMIAAAIAWTGRTGREVLATEKRFGKNAGEKEEPLEIPVGERTVRLSGSIDRVDRTAKGELAILDYKTGSSGNYREHPEYKLQQYLYTRAAEALEPGRKVAEGGYLFLRDAADYLPVPQEKSEREKKERTVLSLLDWLENEERALTAAPAFVIGGDGAFDGPGDAEARRKEFEKCSRYCEFAAFCPAPAQIRQAREAERREVKADD